MSRKLQPYKSSSKKIAGYGLHYHANNQLIKNATERLLFQCLIDAVRNQLKQSLDNTTVFMSNNDLGRKAGIDRGTTVPNQLAHLETLGLVKNFGNGIKVMCDEYVAIVQYYESLTHSEQIRFAKDFRANGMSVVEKYAISVDSHNREELLGLSGSSISVDLDKVSNVLQKTDNEAENCRTFDKLSNPLHQQDTGEYCRTFDSLAGFVAKCVECSTTLIGFSEFIEALGCREIDNDDIEALQFASKTGKFPNFYLERVSNILQPGCRTFYNLASKIVECSTTVIIEDKKEKMNETSPLKKGSEREGNEIEDDDEDFHESIRKGFERLTNFELPSFDDELPDDENKKEGEDKEGFGTGKEEDENYSQLVINRAERKMRERNPYRKKRFFKRAEIEDIVNYMDDEVKSPYRFFLYLFWWGIFDLYQEHYNPAIRIGEDEELDEDSRERCEWNEMLHAPLPQDEIYRVAQNAYEDLCGAVEQGKYIFGADQDEYEVTFAFKEFDDFIPYHTFQWKPCTMQDKSVPALRVEIDKFYDIETDDCYVAPARSRSTNKIRNAHSRKMTAAILSSDESQLTPMEAAIKKFYDAFVVLSDDDNMVDQWKDGRGEVLEYCDKLPDHILKPWCIGLKGIGYNGLTSVMFDKYKPIEGLHRRPWPFSAELVVEWNERNGYLDTIAHQAIKDDEDSETEEEI